MTYQPAPTQPGRGGTQWLFIVGVVLLLVALLMCGIGGFTGMRPALDLADKPEQTAPQSVQLEEGESVSVWSQTSSATCTVLGPGGPVSNSGTSEQNISLGDKEFHRVMAFDADRAGSYTVSCTAPFVVGDGIGVGGIVVAALGSGLCCLAVVLVVVGLVLWLRRRRS